MGKGSQRNQGKTKNQRRDEIERKRDERSQRNALKREKQANNYADDEALSKSFRNQLAAQGLRMRDVIGDGNCLFRAFADQMDGNESMHRKHRKEVVSYMEAHEDEFIPFLEETVSFKDYLKNLSSQGTYGGNDSIVAFARSNEVDVVIHQLHNPTFIIEGNGLAGQKTIVHLAYHDYEHYSSVRRSNDPCTGAAHVFHKETDSIATEKCNDKKENESTVTSQQGCELSQGSHKVRRKNKKKQIQMSGEIKCEASDGFISEAIEELTAKSGCTDTEYIRNIFVDNSYDIDTTLSFLLQTMDLHDNGKPDAEQRICAGADLEVSVPDHTCDNTEEQQNELEDDEKENVDIKEALSSLSCSCAESVQCTLNCNCNCEGVKEEEKESCTSGAKKKNVSTTSNRQVVVAKHMSNRQRKELAKQARKKRRQETRKEDSNKSESLSEQAGTAGGNIKINI